jgi:hypothetical protein
MSAERLDEAIHRACVRRFALETHPSVGYSERSS